LAEGRCFELAARIFFEVTDTGEKAVLVHGFITFPSGNRINHAWVEVPSRKRVLDYGTEKDTLKESLHVYDLDMFYKNKVEVQARYDDLFKVAEIINSTQTWGPYRWIDYLKANGTS
jgi:hypothetical protein